VDVQAVAPDIKQREHPSQDLTGTGTEGAPSGMIPSSSTAAMTLIAAELIQDHSATEFGASLARSAAKPGAVTEPGAVNGLAATLSQSLPKPENEPPVAVKVAPPQPDLAPRPARPSSEAGKQPRATGPETTGRDPNQLATPAHATLAARAPMATGQTTQALAPAGEAGWGGSPGFETQDSTTLPGWSLHLAQGASAKRQEFLAVLRQQLMSLPAHEQISVQMQRALRDGAGRVTIQLHPAELGRIHVRMEIDEDRKVAATITAERPATLDLLQRDARLLERALQEAGLKLDANGMSFGLARDQANQEGPTAGGPRGLPTAASDSQAPEPGDANEPALVDIASGLLNLRV
jgi:flagellar hook-length control protein FliK